LKFDFCTVTWGDWHTGIFLDVNLPSLLAEGNLSAFAKQHDVRYRIFTSVHYKRVIQAHPAYIQAATIVPFEFIECPLENVANPIGMHHALWRRSVEGARDAKRFILFVPPDVIWSQNAFGNIANRFSEGKKAVFMTYLRVLSETCVPAVQSAYGGDGSAVLDIPSRELVNMAIEHMHPLSLAYVRGSSNFPIHPEFILWPVAGEGYMMRVLVREMFAYDPGLVDLNRNALPAHTLKPEEVHFITDSDELFALSLAPLRKDLEWFVRPQRLDPLRLASWWLIYDSPANDLASNQYFRVHHGEMDADKWRRVEKESDVLMARLRGSREILRIIGEIDGFGNDVAQQLLFLIIGDGRWVQNASGLPPSTFFLPSASALSRWLEKDGAEYLSRKSRRAFWNLLREHLVIGYVAMKPGQDMVLKTAAGSRRQLTWQDGDIPLIDGVRVIGDAKQLQSHVMLEVGDVLPVPARPAAEVDGRSSLVLRKSAIS
jgi:hypothetical protein